MSDNLDDDVLGEEPSFDDFEQQNTLGDLWRNNPMVKVGIILAAGAAIFGTIILFGGEKVEPETSYVQAGADVTSAPGTENATQKYVDAIQDFNEQEVENAIRNNGSVLPVPIDPPVSKLTPKEQEQEEEDPLQRWRRLQEERLTREMQQKAIVEQTQVPEQATARSQAVEELAGVLSSQMGAILESKSQNVFEYRTVTMPEMPTAAGAEGGQGAESTGAGEEIVKEILLPAAEIVYAQIMTEANSDAPGPVMAQIVSGPLKGYRVLGEFSVEKELLIVTFDKIVIDGKVENIDAIMLDPDTTLPAMATEVDHHYLQRIVLPMAAAFVEGVAEAGEKSTTTVVVVDGAAVESQSDPSSEEEISFGIDKAGEELGEILDEINEDLETTVIIHAGTPIGILFLEEVTRDKNES